MPQSVMQPSLSGGELAPSLYGRVDIDRYQTSVALASNFITRPYGGQTNRSGFQFINEIKSSANTCRLIPFEFNNQTTYVIELGDLYARFISNGGYVMDGLVPFELVTPWALADLDAIRFTQSADVMYFCHPSYQQRTITRTGGDKFEIGLFESKRGPFRPINASENTKIAASATTGNITITANAAIFTSGMVGGLVYFEQPELKLHRPWNQGERSTTLTVGDKRRSDGKNYQLTTIPTGGGATWTECGSYMPAHEVGKAYDGGGDVRTNGTQTWVVGMEWKFLDHGYGVARITEFVSATSVKATVTHAIPASCVGTITATGSIPARSWAVSYTGNKTLSITGAVSTNVSDYEVSYEKRVYDKENDYYYYETVLVSVVSVDATADTITIAGTITNGKLLDIVEMGGTPTYSITGEATNLFAHGAWSNANGWPAEVEFFGDRLVFANTTAEPQTVWFSSIGNYIDFGKSSPIEDADSIAATIAARRINPITDLVPMQRLMVMTGNTEWMTTTGNEDVLAPTTIAFQPQSYYGSSDVPALTIGNAAVFCEARTNAIRDMSFSNDVQGYSGDDLGAYANHLLVGHAISEWCYQKTPFNVVWIVRDDGVLLSMSYMREQGITGWNRHDVGGIVESICCVPEGAQDAVYALIKRTINGTTKRYIERLSNRLYSDIRLATFLDSHLTIDSRNTTSTTMTLTAADYSVGQFGTLTASASTFSAPDVGDYIVLGYDAGDKLRLKITGYTSATAVDVLIESIIPASYQNAAKSDWGFGRDVMAGLSHLNGELVSVYADGEVQASKTVSGGQITVDRHAVICCVGKPYVSDLETLEIAAQDPNVRTKNRTVSKVDLIVQDSRGIFAGPDADNLDEYEGRTVDENYSLPTVYTDAVEIYIKGDWAKRGRVYVRQSYPLPVTVLAVIPEISVGT